MALADIRTPCKRSASPCPVRFAGQIANGASSASVWFWSRVSMKLGIEKNARLTVLRVAQIHTKRFGSLKDKGFRITAFTILKIELLAAIATANIRTTSSENPGRLRSERTA